MKLSICMPTYNFGPYIGETLDSIIHQLNENVEIIILDGGSTDNTAAVVTPYCQKYPQIKYIHQDHRGGIDRDMSRSIDLSSGDYFWLFSSDDIMKPGAIARILDEIKSGLDVYLCGLTLCDKYINIIRDHKVSDAKDGEIFDLTKTDDRERYFRLAITTTALFSFMSSLIIRRSWWDLRPFDEDYDRTCWAHAARMMSHMNEGFTLKYIKDSLLLKRGDNDSFLTKGRIHRYGIAIDGYHRIADNIFGYHTMEAQNIRRVVVNEFPAKSMLFSKIDITEETKIQDNKELKRLVSKLYKDKNLTNYRHRFVFFILNFIPVESRIRYILIRLKKFFR